MYELLVIVFSPIYAHEQQISIIEEIVEPRSKLAYQQEKILES